MTCVPNVGKNAYLLSIIDDDTRIILKDYFSFNIKQNHIIDLLSKLFDEYNYPESLVIKSNNSSQFIAKSVREYLGLIVVQQEFTYIATPEENAHTKPIKAS
ncbi:MAG: putative transposase [Glaciecola sp.]|jgi:putative transposase